MDSIRIDIANARQVGLRFDTFPDALYEDLKTEINALSIELYARIQAATPNRTGALRAAERLRIFADQSRITGYVDIAGAKGSQLFAKASALEYGAHRSTKVKAHSMGLDHHWSKKLDQPQEVLVKAYSRTPNIQEVAFERGPLATMQPEVAARLNAVVAKATAEANA
jgi:hypothetical protein